MRKQSDNSGGHATAEPVAGSHTNFPKSPEVFLFMTVGNTTLGQIVRRHLESDAVAG